jgi:hypothetical protein
MGTYCYSILSPKRVVSVLLSDGRSMDAALSTFSHKPTTDGFFNKPKAPWERMKNLQLDAMDARWADREMPPLMIKVDKDVMKPQVDDGVYVCKRGSYFDGGEIGVGKVCGIDTIKRGRKTVTVIRVNVIHPENVPAPVTPEQ